MQKLKLEQLDALARGASILGSGGGGCPAVDLQLTRYMLEQHGAPHLITVDELADNDLVVPVAFVGAPLVGIEKLPRGDEIDHLVALVESYTGKKVAALVPAEIGGSNALCPFAAAAKLGIPVLDADTLGRAFPEMQMSTCNLHGIDPSPAFIVGALGNSATLHPQSSDQAEQLLRDLTCAMGMSSAVALYLMDGRTARKSLIAGSISRAIAMGKERQPGTSITSGTITDVKQELAGGFLSGSFTIDHDVVVDYQNEYLLATQNGEVIAATPDIITLLEEESGEPVPSERLRYGLRVQLILLPAPPVWKTPAGLKLVGPEAFNLGRRK